MAKTLKDWRGRKADYIRTDQEVSDLVEFLGTLTIVNAAGSIDLDDADPVLVGVTVDRHSGERPKAAVAISQDVHETKNSIINRADDLLRHWYLQHNNETVESLREAGEEYDSGWEAEVWQLKPEAVNFALDELQKRDGTVFDNVTLDREF